MNKNSQNRLRILEIAQNQTKMYDKKINSCKKELWELLY